MPHAVSHGNANDINSSGGRDSKCYFLVDADFEANCYCANGGCSGAKSVGITEFAMSIESRPPCTLCWQCRVLIHDVAEFLVFGSKHII